MEEGVELKTLRVVVKARRAVVVWGLRPEGQRVVSRRARGEGTMCAGEDGREGR